MSKTSTDLERHALHGPTMGTRWTALFHAAAGLDVPVVQAALQDAVTEIDQQMSNWKPDSDLTRINTAPVGEWLDVPRHLLQVLRLAFEVGRASGGAFDVGLGDATAAWGFGPSAASSDLIRTALQAKRQPSWELVELGEGRLRKLAPVSLDLNGIAKGYGVDRLSETLTGLGITAHLVGIDGELRAAGTRPDGELWSIAVERPDIARRDVHSVLTLSGAAVATSGDYRHFVEVNGRRLSHTMDPRRGAPLMKSPASVTVVAESCARADSWATALMVLGPDAGRALAERQGLEALFLMHGEHGAILAQPAGPLFSGTAGPAP